MSKPVKQDPDSFLRNKTPKTAAAWLGKAQDYLCEYLPAELQKKATNPHAMAAAIKDLGEVLELVADPVQRSVFYEDLRKKWPAFTKNYRLKQRKEEKKGEPKRKIILKADEWTYTVINYKNEAQSLNGKLSEDQVRCIKQYGFVEHGNAYYFGEPDLAAQTVRLYQKSNFTLRLLYHIKRSKNKNKRVVALINQRGRSEVLDIETSQLITLNKFREFTEGAGFFIFKGSDKDIMSLKTKLLEEERQCTQLDTLGWQKIGFFAFSNGVIRNGEFAPVDEFGIVAFSDRNYFIPYHPNTDETESINEKRFSWKPGPATWDQWSKLYHQVFGDAGMVSMIFGCATLFSDHIFYVKTNFPILFLYGEGGSGKSKMIQFIQHWFGDPQPPLKVNEKANTDKSKIRKMAQFSNAIAFFEEFVNGVDISLIKTFTGFYDRFGYERSTMDSKYGTETVPVQSTVVFTGNEYPNDDPFLQRTILIDHNVNQFTQQQQERFDELNKLNRKGLTQVTMELLKFRKVMEEKWEDTYEADLAEFKKICSDVKVPSRMLENNAVLISTFSVLKNAGLYFPFEKDQLTAFLHTVLTSQANKRDVGGATQRFWDIVVHLISSRKIEQGKHLELNGDKLLARVTELHSYYMQEHYSLHRTPALNKTTLLQKLRDSPAFIEAKGHRFGEQNTSCYVFDTKQINVDFAYWLQAYPAQSGPRPTESHGESQKQEQSRPASDKGHQGDIAFGGQKTSSTDDLPF